MSQRSIRESFLAQWYLPVPEYPLTRYVKKSKHNNIFVVQMPSSKVRNKTLKLILEINLYGPFQWRFPLRQLNLFLLKHTTYVWMPSVLRSSWITTLPEGFEIIKSTSRSPPSTTYKMRFMIQVGLFFGELINFTFTLWTRGSCSGAIHWQIYTRSHALRVLHNFQSFFD